MKLAKVWKILRVPPRVAFNKALDKIRSKFSQDRESSFFRKFYLELNEVPFNFLNYGYFPIPDEDFLAKKDEIFKFLSSQVLQHKFNLLGTGWICRNHTLRKEQIIDLLPTFWQKEAMVLYRKIESTNYLPINFWNDPKKNYQWNPRFYKNIPILLGADIKQPWELGRMQHLPILAYCYYYFKMNDEKIAQNCKLEFRNEIVDFIASNPVGYSVQWASPMDVSIRLANWLVAYDLFVNAGCSFDEWFLSTFFDAVYKHILFVIDNFEWSGGLRGNHYYANIVSMIFAGAYLPNDEFSANILAFGINELINETLYQFNEDGGNFEASTYYHLQTTEMLLLALYLLCSLNKEKFCSLYDFVKSNKRILLGNRNSGKIRFELDLETFNFIFPKEFLERLFKIVKFTRSIRKPLGEYEQIGDNDSGYFLRLDYFFDSFEVKNERFPNVLKRYLLEELINCLSKNNDNITNLLVCDKTKQFFLPPDEVYVYPKLTPFEQFGLYVVKSAEYSLFIRCGSVGQKGKGGHSHNDQLSVTLNVRGNDIFVDPGLYCYTCSEEERNKFRSVHHHNTVCLKNKEQNIWKTGTAEELFWIYKEKTKAKLLGILENSVEVVHFAYGKPHVRKICFDPQSIRIYDTFDLDCEKLLHFHLHPNVEIVYSDVGLLLVNGDSKVSIFVDDCNLEIMDYDYCPQYGLKLCSKKLVYRTNNNKITSRIEIL